MHDVAPFAVVILLVAAALCLAVTATRVAEFVRVPVAALFLAVAAAASNAVPRLADVSVVDNQRIVTVALAVILFDGGLRIGWQRMRAAAAGVVWLGVAGTIVTAGGLAVVAHVAFGFGWRPALLLGAALAPTDPAVVFSVLGRREIAGRSGTLLEGESGANDPVGIALMVSLLGATGGGWSAVGSGVGHFLLQLGVGAAVGAAGGWAIAKITPRLRLGSSALYAIFVVGLALVLYGAATALEGSGFLAVFVAGILAGDRALPEKRSVVGFAGALAALGEIVAFVVLGLSVDLSSVFTGARVWTALGLAALLILVIRPVLVGLVSAPIRLSRGERWFVLLAGLKGAVPILLGTYVLAESAPRAGEIYDIVFVVVLVSVVVQGGLVPAMTRLFRIPLRVGPETSTDRGSE